MIITCANAVSVNMFISAIGSLFFVYVILRPDTEGFSAALSERAWIVVRMPDSTVQLTTRKKQWKERVVPATVCVFGQVGLTVN